MRQGAEGKGRESPGKPAQQGRLWLGRLVACSNAIRDPAERERARLLAGLLLALIALGTGSGVLQLLLIPGFWPTFAVMLVALAVIGGAYAVSRTRYFRTAAWAAALAPIAACAVVTRSDPSDAVSGAFMLIGVLIATLFLSAHAALGIACGALAALVVALEPWQASFDARRGAPLLAFQAVVSPLLLIAAAHRDRIEELRKEAQRNAQAELHEARQMELLGRLAGGIAHDFNNLLTVIVANVESLERLGGEQTRSLTEDIHAALERGAGLTRQLLALARKQLLEPRSVDLNALLQGLQGLLRRLIGSHISLQIEVEGALPPVHADPSQLEQVVLNLVLNARDAMPRGGVLRISAARAEAQPAAGAGWVRLSVTDNGVGMDSETQENLFKPFFTTKGASGTGLGLATVRGIVEQSGGRIDVVSAPERGARFDVLLPVAPPPIRSEGAGVSRGRWKAPAGSARVLIVDDEMLVGRAIEHMLLRMGLSATSVQRGAQAIDLFEREAGRFDLLLCDVMIPDLPGLEIARRLRQKDPSLPVLFVSGFATPAARAVSELSSAFLLAKPFSQEELSRKLEQVLGPRAARERARLEEAPPPSQ
jgi:signal transduction histidine kinase/ActR/RegA family two-component response regulator